MHITAKELKQLIKEAVQQTLLKEYEQSLFKRKDGSCYIVDDEGNKEPYNGPECDSLEPGQSMPFERSSRSRYGGSYGGYGYDSYSGGSSYGRRRRRY